MLLRRPVKEHHIRGAILRIKCADHKGSSATAIAECSSGHYPDKQPEANKTKKASKAVPKSQVGDSRREWHYHLLKIKMQPAVEELR